MILDATTKKLQVVLAGAITSAQLQVNVSWADTQNGATFVPGSNSAATNSATPVDIVPAPAASTQRQVKEVTVQNTDTVAATVTVQTVDGANTRKNIVVTIQSGETLFFAAGSWGVLATNGAIKGSAGVSSVALTMPGVIFNASVPGSPITTTGTLAPTLATQTANTLLAGPTTGAAATPTFRTVVAADLNSLALASGGLVFGSTGGGLAQDAANAFWDATNHRLGIGQAGYSTPESAISVNKNTGASISALVGSSVFRGIGADAAGLTFELATFNGGAGTNTASFVSRSAAGTRTAPAALASGDRMASVQASGWDGVATFRTGGIFFFRAAELFSATATGTDFVLNQRPVGSITAADTLVVYGDGRTQPFGAYCEGGQAYQTPLTGATITQGNAVETLICEPAGAIAALTVNTPASPKDGQRFRFTCTQAVTALTIQANAGQTLLAPLTAAVYVANTPYAWQYKSSTAKWYRIT